MMAFLFWHQILELEHLALARRRSDIFRPLLAFGAAAFEFAFSKKLAASAGPWTCFSKLSQILFVNFTRL